MDQAAQLRNIIKMQSPPRKIARVIAVTSGKGGVGKSSVSVNIGIQMSRLGKRVVILDADFGLANVEIMLGIRPKYTLADLIFRGKSLQDIITEGPEGIGFISGGSGIQELSNVTKDQVIFLTQKLYELDELADVIIIDTGAGISDSVLEFITVCSEVLLIATPEPTSITDAYALLKTLNRRSEFSIEKTRIKMIANRVSSREEALELYNKLNLVVAKFLDIKLQYLGEVPQDPNVTKAVMQQIPYSMLYPNTPSTKAVIRLAGLLCDSSADEKETKKGIAQMFNNLIRIKKQNRI